MQNSTNTASSFHVNEASTVTPESGNNNIQGFNFRYPTFTEDVFIKHPSAIYLSEKERLNYAYSFLRDSVFPYYNKFKTTDEPKANFESETTVDRKIFDDLNTWIDKVYFDDILWKMLQYSISDELADCNSDFRSNAMTLYRKLQMLSIYIFDKSLIDSTLSKDIFSDINTWIDKEHFTKILWEMLEYSIASELADGDRDFRSCAMMLYEMLKTLSDSIFL